VNLCTAGLTFALLAASSLYAQTPASHPLTLAEALELADRQSPQLRIANALRAGAEAGTLTAKAYPNLEFNQFTGRQYLRQPSAAPGLLQHYSVGQQIELPSVRRNRMEAALHGVASSEHYLRESRLAVRAMVKQTFYQALRRQAEIVLAQENLKLIEDLRRRIQVQVGVGEAARLELVRAEAEVATARNQVRSAELRLVTAISALRAAIGGSPLTESLTPVGQLDPVATLPPLDDVRTDVLARHPAVAQAITEVQRSEARLRTEKALRKPSPQVRAEWENQPDLGFYRFGISIPLPLWNKRQGPIAEASADVTRASATADLRRLELTAALERAYGQYQVASQQVVAFEQGILREAQSALQAAEAAFKFGERGIIEVLDSQRVLRSVRTDYLNAQYDRQAALIDLEQLRAIEISGITK